MGIGELLLRRQSFLFIFFLYVRWGKGIFDLLLGRSSLIVLSAGITSASSHPLKTDVAIPHDCVLEMCVVLAG